METLAAQHLRACHHFSRAVSRVGTRWSVPSPCPEWDARGVVEHVIGLHDVLLLRPLGAKPSRPRQDVAARWAVTVSALSAALEELDPTRLAALEAAADTTLGRLLPALTTDVLVHTWDLAAAVGAPRDLDAELCTSALARVAAQPDAYVGSGRFGPPVPVAEDAEPFERLVGRLGRDPYWSPPG